MPGRLGRTGPIVLGGMLGVLPAPLLLSQAGRLRLGSEAITFFDGPALTFPCLVEFHAHPFALRRSGSLFFRKLLRRHSGHRRLRPARMRAAHRFG